MKRETDKVVLSQNRWKMFLLCSILSEIRPVGFPND